MLQEIHQMFGKWTVCLQIDTASEENAVPILFTDDCLAQQHQPVLSGRERLAPGWGVQALSVCWFRPRGFRGGACHVHLGSLLYNTFL